MLKALLKKQFRELGSLYLQNRKTGQSRSRAGSKALIVLFAFLFLILGASFFMIAYSFSGALISAGLSWLYFAVMGVAALMFGVFGSVFNTYAGLYHAKDNELLLSMPIPPSAILFARMVGVYFMGLLFESLVFVPAMIAFWVECPVGVGEIAGPILTYLALSFLILAMTCLLGWIVALIASKLKNKSLITVLISLVLVGAYYYVCFNSDSLISALTENSEEIGSAIQRSAYPLYLIGSAGAGSWPEIGILIAAVALLTAVTVWILSKTFVRITTTRSEEKKPVYRETAAKVSSADAALFRKEWKHFLSSATYMLNCALGTIFMPLIGILALVFRSDIQNMLTTMEVPAEYLALSVLAAACFAGSMIDLTAPSVSLEGSSIWILQASPVSPKKVLDAKQRLHCVMGIPPVIFLCVCLSVALNLELVTALLCTVFACVFILAISALGLILNLKKPTLIWTNETVTVKQSVSVLICLFGGWLFGLLVPAGGYFALKIMNMDHFLLIAILVVTLLTRLLNRWLDRTGTEIFASL